MEETLDRTSLSLSDKTLLEKLLVKSPSALEEEEIGIIRARRAYLTSVEREIFKEVLEVEEEQVEYSKLNKAGLEELCANREIVIPEGATKAVLVSLLEEADKVEEEQE